MSNQKKILIAPLDWGLGHATRCIPLIKYLVEKKVNVIIAADGRPYDLLKEEFPALEFIRLPGYDIQYPSSGNMIMKMLFSTPLILKGIREEHKALEKIIAEKKIDAVISDNRFGLWSKKVYSVFITHQLMIKSPFGEGLLHSINKNFINKYNECWAPDYNPSSILPEGEEVISLSGDLSHRYPLPANAKFIGPLSRFEKTTEPASYKYDLLITLSGPEVQRSIFEGIILEQIKTTSLKTLVVKGIPAGRDLNPDQEIRKVSEKIETVSYLNSTQLQKAMNDSKIVLCRSGYSSIMDLAALDKKAIFIPTPGQTEQEYLAEYFKEKKIAYAVSQKEFHLEKALRESENYKGFEIREEKNLYKKVVDLFLEKITNK